MQAFAAKLTGLTIVVGILILTGTAAAHRDSAYLSSAEARFITGKAVAPALAPTATPAAPLGPSPGPETAHGQPRKAPAPKEEFKQLAQALDELLAGNPAQIGIAVRRVNGAPLFMRNSQQPFPLASVIKIYMLVGYLDRLEKEGRQPDIKEIDMLQAMIEISDNDSAEEIWQALGGIDAMQAYLGGIGMKGLVPPSIVQQSGGADKEAEAWGDTAQTPGEMSRFLARLLDYKLLNPEDTLLVQSLLGQVVEAQAWGVSAGVEELDPAAKVLFKNGWYPAGEGWRINAAGIVLPGGGREPYVTVILRSGLH